MKTSDLGDAGIWRNLAAIGADWRDARSGFDLESSRGEVKMSVVSTASSLKVQACLLLLPRDITLPLPQAFHFALPVDGPLPVAGP